MVKATEIRNESVRPVVAYSFHWSFSHLLSAVDHVVVMMTACCCRFGPPDQLEGRRMLRPGDDVVARPTTHAGRASTV